MGQDKMSGKRPRVSIGMPVFNADKYLEEALDSILSQTYSDFELIISDNASNDRTREICTAYAAADERIQYHRNRTNLGAARNFNRVFEMSTGEYFKWASYDDVLGPAYLSRCVEILDRDPLVVACHSKTGRIDEHSELVSVYEEYQYLRLTSNRPHERFFDLIRLNHSCNIVFGLMRSSALEKTSLIGPYPASDRPLLAQLGLMGQLYEIPEILFYRRDHPETTWRVWGESPEVITWYDPTKAKQISLPYWRLFWEYRASIGRIPLKWTDRLLCYVELVRLSRQTWRQDMPMWRWLIVDLERAAGQLTSRLRSRVSRVLTAGSDASEEAPCE